MKTKLLLLLLSLCLLTACSHEKKMSWNDVQDKPQFTGVITNLLFDEGGTLVVRTEDEIGESFVKVRLRSEVEDNYGNPQLGDEVRVYYNGKIEEGVITHPYAIKLEMSKYEYCKDLLVEEASERDFERCGIDQKLMYEEKLHDEMPNQAKYSINHFEDAHLLEITKKVHAVIWNWYVNKANSTWKDKEIETHTQLVKINGENKFTIVSSTYENFAKYFMYGVEFDEDTNTYVLTRIHESNENTVSKRLLKVLNDTDSPILIDIDFTQYKQNEVGDYVPNVTPYFEYTIRESDNVENIHDKIYSFVVNEMGCDLSTKLGYCDIDTYYYYKDDKFIGIVADVSNLLTNQMYYFTAEEGEIYFRQGIHEFQLPLNGVPTMYETIDGKKTILRKDKVLYETSH